MIDTARRSVEVALHDICAMLRSKADKLARSPEFGKVIAGDLGRLYIFFGGGGRDSNPLRITVD